MFFHLSSLPSLHISLSFLQLNFSCPLSLEVYRTAFWRGIISLERTDSRNWTLSYCLLRQMAQTQRNPTDYMPRTYCSKSQLQFLRVQATSADTSAFGGIWCEECLLGMWDFGNWSTLGRGLFETSVFISKEFLKMCFFSIWERRWDRGLGSGCPASSQLAHPCQPAAATCLEGSAVTLGAMR